MKIIEVSTPKHPNMFAQVDDEDFERCKEGPRWYAYLPKNKRSFYAQRSIKIRGKYHTQQLHRFILSMPVNQKLDHKDRNGLNCKRTNLRPCTDVQNQGNRSKEDKRKTSSSFKGVSFYKPTKKWRSYIRVDKKLTFLGDFQFEIAAAKAYDTAAVTVFGDFARLNFPNNSTERCCL